MTVKYSCQKFFNPDTQINDFDARVYDACLRIPAGKVSTYKSIARVVGSPKAYRAVGSALKRNPFAPQVPCHRVVSSDLTLGGFFGSTDPRGAMLMKKVKMLKDEGVTIESKRPGGAALTTDSVANVKVSKESFYDFE